MALWSAGRPPFETNKQTAAPYVTNMEMLAKAGLQFVAQHRPSPGDADAKTITKNARQHRTSRRAGYQMPEIVMPMVKKPEPDSIVSWMTS